MPAIAMPALVPALSTAAIGWLLYRRLRTSFGCQPWQPRRTILRMCVLAIAALALGSALWFLPSTRLGIGLGAALGATLAWVGARTTQVGRIDGRACYTPNPWIGGVLILLLAFRLLMRWQQGAFAAGSAQAMQQASPLTLAIAAALVAYLFLYSGFLLLRMRALEAEAR